MLHVTLNLFFLYANLVDQSWAKATNIGAEQSRGKRKDQLDNGRKWLWTFEEPSALAGQRAQQVAAQTNAESVV